MASPNVSFYQFTQFFNTIALAHPNVTTFTIGDIKEVDLAKTSLFPILHLVPNTVTIGQQMMDYNIDLVYLDKTVDVNIDSSGSYNLLTKNYKTVANTHDVWNTGLLALNDIYAYIARNAQAENYIITTDAVCTPFQEQFDNVCAGWAMNLIVSVPNSVDACLFAISDNQAEGNTDGCTLADPELS